MAKLLIKSLTCIIPVNELNSDRKTWLQTQAAQAQDERRRTPPLQQACCVTRLSIYRLCTGNSPSLSKCMGLLLCLVRNFTAIRGRFRRVFGSVLFTVLFLHIKQRKAGDKRVPQIALVSQSNAENRLRNTIFIRHHNYHIQFSLHGDCTEILV